MMKCVFKLCVIGLLSFSVIACGSFYSQQGQSVNDTHLNITNKQQQHAVTNLDNSGGVVSSTKEGKVAIILPSASVFPGHSSQLRESSTRLLDNTVSVLKTYHTGEIVITAFDTRSQALAFKQAQAVQHYLWQHNVQARLMYSKGKKISAASNEIPRVEIQIQKMA